MKVIGTQIITRLGPSSSHDDIVNAIAQAILGGSTVQMQEYGVRSQYSARRDLEGVYVVSSPAPFSRSSTFNTAQSAARDLLDRWLVDSR